MENTGDGAVRANEFGSYVLKAIHEWASKQSFPLVDDVGYFAENVLHITKKTFKSRLHDGNWLWHEIKIMRREFVEIAWWMEILDRDLGGCS